MGKFSSDAISMITGIEYRRYWRLGDMGYLWDKVSCTTIHDLECEASL